uniref:Solute carrier family 7 member 13 n=1 Tax=Equus asinus TaxID=9793 RepID=A0A8C4MJ11_EQUAS
LQLQWIKGRRSSSKVFGSFWVTRFVTGNVIGAGILVAPKGVLKYSSMNVGLSLCIWAARVLSAVMTSLCSAEIGTTFPCSGANVDFLKRCFGNPVFSETLDELVSAARTSRQPSPASRRVISIQPLYSSCSAPNLPKKCLALAILWVVGILNSCGGKEITWLQTASTTLKVAVLGLISLSGGVLLVRGRKENVGRFQNAFASEFPEATQYIEAVFQGYFAYSGGGCIIFIAGDKTQTDNSKCILTALPLVTVLYLLVNISYLTLLTPREILSSDAVVVMWSDRVIPSLTRVIPFAISVSSFSNLLANIFESSRMTYIAGQEGQLPLLFNMLNIPFSPFMSVLLLVTVASVGVVSTNLIDLINYLYFASSIWSLLSMIGILKPRYQKPNLPRPYKVKVSFLTPQYIVVYSSLWVLLVVACGMLPQRGLMSSAMSVPRIRTNETLGHLQRSART